MPFPAATTVNTDLLEACKECANLLNRFPTTRAFSHIVDEKLDRINKVIARAEAEMAGSR